MQRREFTQAVLMAGSATTGLLGATQAHAQAAFKEGSDYLKLGRPAPVDTPADKVEVVVVDDGSTDDSLAVLARYRDHPQVKVLQQPNRGQTAAFDAGVRQLDIALDDGRSITLEPLVRIGSQTIADQEFYERLFLLINRFLLDEDEEEGQQDGGGRPPRW